MIQKGVRVYCPECRHRLLDNMSTVDGVIAMKCSCCKKVVTINFEQVARGKRYLSEYYKNMQPGTNVQM